MKDTAISYDLVHHQHHQQQPHQPQHSWNQQRQQQLQTHTTSIYSNHHQHMHQNVQNSHGRQPQQQTQQHDNQVGQYSHQQLQSAAAAAAVAAHHNAPNNAAAYYQQATHIYPTYHGQQEQQQQTGTDHHAHHHPGASVSTPNNVNTSALNAAVVAASQQHANGGAPSGGPLNHHTGWSPAGVGALAAAASAAHHAVVTDHSTLAYIAHAYQSHNTSAVNDHRNSTGPIASQPIGSGAQAPTYTVDTLYSTPAAAAAAVAAYGYNNYNAAFFQTSNNGPHAQTGHPTPAGLSTFWNQTTQHQQQRTTHSQTVSNQATLQQRQQLTSDQSNSYLHDPRLYTYGRPQYNQNNAQNFGLHQQQTDLQQHHQQQPHQHQRMSANLSQHTTLLQHQHEHSQQPMTLQLNHHPPNDQSQSLTASHQFSSNVGHVQHDHDPESRKMQSTLRVSPQHQHVQKQQNDIDPTKNKSDFEHRPANQLVQQQKIAQTSQHTNASNDKADSRGNNQANKDGLKSSTHPAPTANSISPKSKTQSVMKADNEPGQYQQGKGGIDNSTQHSSIKAARNIYRAPQEDRVKSQTIESSQKKFSGDSRDMRSTDSAVNHSSGNSKQNDSLNNQVASLDDNMATLSLGPRKTTWASIASQPAKVSQPKSLKSKIAGSNSVLSTTNKHLTTSVTIDSSNLDSKGGINPAIKSSVSAAATTMPRAPPPAAKIASAAVASLKLDILGDDCTDSKISWPAVNASINLNLDDSIPQKPSTVSEESRPIHPSDRMRKDDGCKGHENFRDSRDHNHNHGPGKFMNSYTNRDDRRHDDWHRREPREFRSRRDSDRREDIDKRPHPVEHEDLRDHLNARRDFKQSGRGDPVRFRQQDEPMFRDFKQSGGPGDRKDNRGNDGYNRYPANSRALDHGRDMHHNSNSNRLTNDNPPHHHYNNLRDGNSTKNPQLAGKLDLNVHPHLNPDNFNPKTFDCEPENARFFIIKSYSEDDIHRSIKYSVWCSTNHGNKRLDDAYRQQLSRKGQLFLFFSVNGSGHFCGIAQMTSTVDFESSSGIWAQSKWQGEFNVKWIYVKDVPNSALRHITLENNEDKPVTNSRDTQEVLSEKGKAVLKIIHQYPHQTSLFDDFLHYERRQEEEKAKKSSQMDHHPNGPPMSRDHDRERGGGGGARFGGRPYTNPRPHNDFPNRDRPTRYA